MVEIFAGSDTFTSYQAAKRSLAARSETHNLPIEIIEADELTVPRLIDLWQGGDLFSPRRAILLKRLFDSSISPSQLTAIVQSSTQNEIVIWHEAEVDAKLSKLIPKDISLKQFEVPKPRQFPSWIQSEARTLGLRLNNNQASLILEIVGPFKWLIYQEIQKLSLWQQIKKQTIDETVISRLVINSQVPFEIWTLLDKITSGDKQGVLKLIKYYSDDENYHQLIAMLTRELELLLQVDSAIKSGEENKISLHQFVLEKTKAKLRRYDKIKIAELLRSLWKMDIAVKKFNLDPLSALILHLWRW